jgi:hypothetical protein
MQQSRNADGGEMSTEPNWNPDDHHPECWCASPDLRMGPDGKIVAIAPPESACTCSSGWFRATEGTTTT